MPFLSTNREGCLLLKVYVQPRASRNGFTGLHGDAIRLAITAPPVDGKANKAVIKFLASFFHIKKIDLKIKHGLQSRRKTVLIAGLSADEVMTALKEIIK
jgi:uncharacterized protein (TIGR00251 family)